MKILMELRNINGNMADIYTPDGMCVCAAWCFSNAPESYAVKEEVSLSKIVKLKEAGFDSEDIMKMHEKGML